MIRVFTDRMCLLQPPGYSYGNKQGALQYWVDIGADRGLCWLHRSYCRFCRALVHFRVETRKYYFLFSEAMIKVMFLGGGGWGKGGGARMLIWAVSYESVSSGICRQRRPISA